MASFRALYFDEDMGGSQYRLRIRNDNHKNNRQWWIFDSRTHTIRAFSNKNLAISNQNGQAFKINVAAVVRPYKNEVYQRLSYYSGTVKNLRNNAQKCLDVHGAVNAHKRHVIFYNCHNGANQGWFLTSKVPRPLPPAPKPKPAPKPTLPPVIIYPPAPVPAKPK